MCHRDTSLLCKTGAIMLVAWGALPAQVTTGIVPSVPEVQWRSIGNSSIERGFASPATGPVERVWFSKDGGRLLARTPSGIVFETVDFENWNRLADAAAHEEVPPA